MTRAIHIEPMDEDGVLRMGCLACHYDVNAHYGMATPVRYLDVSLECAECGAEIVRWMI